MKVVHVGQDHRKDDTRIFKKECVFIKSAGNDVVYITSDKNGGDGSQYVDGVRIELYPYRPIKVKGIGIQKFVCLVLNRIARLRTIYAYIVKENPDVVHIHEYKLLYLIGLLKLFKKKTSIIYDIHEDTPRHHSLRFYEKYGSLLGKAIEKKYEIIEHLACRIVDAVIVVTPHIYELVERYNRNTIQVCNFPIVGSETENHYDWKSRERIASFGGGLSKDNGINTLLQISGNLHGKLLLAGSFAGIDYNKDFLNKYKTQIAEGLIQYKGYLINEERKEFYRESYVGVLIYENTPNNFYAYPIKLFEYMEAGIPVVISDFPTYREFIKLAQCGLLVDPKNKDEIICAVNYLFDNPDIAEQMGKNGKKAVMENYNWERESKKLIKLYEDLKRV